MPRAAPWAATELARLPVEAHAIVSKPSSRARVTATDTTRSLKEWVGLAASFLTHTSRRPSRSARRSARISGVQPAGSPTLGAVVELMDPARLSAVVRRLPRAAAGRTQDYLATLTPDQISAVRGLGTRLAIISESHTGAFLEPAPGGRSDPTIDVRAALRGPEVILFSLNSSTYGKLSAQLGTLAVQDLVSAVGDRLTRQAPGETPAQAIIAIDEFSALGSDNVISLLARGRESGASVLLATQELADLDRAAPGLRDQVLGNTAVKLAHRQDVPASAQTIAQMAGTERVWDETEQIGSGLLGDRRAGRGTRRQVEQFVVHPNEKIGRAHV